MEGDENSIPSLKEVRTELAAATEAVATKSAEKAAEATAAKVLQGIEQGRKAEHQKARSNEVRGLVDAELAKDAVLAKPENTDRRSFLSNRIVERVYGELITEFKNRPELSEAEANQVMHQRLNDAAKAAVDQERTYRGESKEADAEGRLKAMDNAGESGAGRGRASGSGKTSEQDGSAEPSYGIHVTADHPFGRTDKFYELEAQSEGVKFLDEHAGK